MRQVLSGVYYRREPVFREWDVEGRRLAFFSRVTRKLPDGSWKFVRWLPLHEVSLSTARGLARRVVAAQLALDYVLKLPGVSKSRM